MQDNDFIAFLNASSVKQGGATFNIKTQHASTQARTILQNTKYSMLAKQHINNNIVQAYNNNAQFKQKLTQVLQDLHITIIA